MSGQRLATVPRSGSHASSLDRVLYRSSKLTVANFAVFPGASHFENPTPIENSIVVFPRTRVLIQHEGEAQIVAAPTVATVYNRGQRYLRRSIAGQADRCDWFALSESALSEVLEGRAASPHRPFVSSFRECPPRIYAAQRQVVRYLEKTQPQAVDRVFVEESVQGLLRALLEVPDLDSVPQEAGWLVTQIKEVMARECCEPVRLASIARELNCSVSYLCKVFKLATGSSVHKYQTRMRLALSLECLDRGHLSRLAFDLGFCSHSHFSDSFRRTFGVTPTCYRETLGQSEIRHLFFA